MLSFKDIFTIVKSDFCDLLDYKQRGDTLEIITSISTITNCHVSIFISFQDGRYIISDGAWISRGLYDNEIHKETENADIADKLLSQYLLHYNVKTILHRNNDKYFYKTTEKESMISAFVFDLAHFVASTVNSQSLFFIGEAETTQRTLFHKEVNDFLKVAYKEEVTFKKGVEDNRIKSKVKFSAIIRKPTKINLLMYVTGSTPTYFNNDICKAASHFEMIQNSLPNANYFNYIAIINNKAEGFDSEKSSDYLDFLAKKTSNPPVNYHGSRNEITQMIPSANR